ncbi:putative dna repair protein rad18 protein [Eutypa lata UCREL1]|uniref:Postreplication repair E3 ubiquitin-protein ligase RAD18 n=1 Tax=Eutypa lata (strain UCR-EL1) TaxID=1287681 RepID=M7TQ50_EUTLA|nr:putative dna repair protein rad18 protein [Eutypa lata UCREL1]
MITDSLDDVADSTDWLSTPLSGLAAVEAALRCQVCKDFYKTPMLTSCNHTFCSVCIRRALSNDGKCPLCRASEQELKLRSNWSMEETVDTFVKTRQDVLDFARRPAVIAAAPDSPKRKRGEFYDEEEEQTTSSSQRSTEMARQEAEIQDSDDDEADDYEPDDGLVACPEDHNHNRNDPETRLPAIHYSMLKEPQLRKKLQELGISAGGTRQMLERRHKEWVTLWNANCDALHPRRKVDLLHDLDAWERTLGTRAPTASRSLQLGAQIKDKDFDGAAWAAKHDDSFKDLIASARKNNKSKTQAQAQEEGKAESAGQGQPQREQQQGDPGLPAPGGRCTGTILCDTGDAYRQCYSRFDER